MINIGILTEEDVIHIYIFYSAILYNIVEFQI